MTGIHSIDPRTPGQLGRVSAVFVADHLNLKGGGAGMMVPAVSAWVYKNGFLQVWPQPPTSAKITVTQGSDWRFQTVLMEAPGATSFSLTVKVGTSPATTLSSGSATSVTWDWFDTSVYYVPGAIVTYELTALNSAGSIVTTSTATLGQVPAPGAPSLTASTSTTLSLGWTAVPSSSTSYQVINTATGAVVKTTSVANYTTISGLTASTTYSYAVRAVVQGSYLNAASFTSVSGGAKSFKTLAAAVTGPSTGTHTVKPSSNATYQWGESGGQSAGWRSTSDDLYHGDGGSVSTRGKQAAHFFYSTRFSTAFPDGLGSKTVTKCEVYLKRLSGSGSSAATNCHWYLHDYSSKPSGAPSGYSSSQDVGSLAWGEGKWFTLPDSWGTALVNGTYRGVVWGYVAGRYMSADNSTAWTTPNGTVRITIA